MPKTHAKLRSIKNSGVHKIKQFYTTTNAKGKTVKYYPYENYSTPYLKFKSLPNAKKYLKLKIVSNSNKLIIELTNFATNEL